MNTAVKNHSASTQLLAVITGVVVIAALHFGKDLVIPFTLALLASFLLSTPVTWLERMRLGRPFAVLLVMAAAVAIAGGLVVLGAGELIGMAKNLPQYRDHIVRKLEILRSPASPGLISAIESLSELTDEVSHSQRTATGGGQATSDGGERSRNQRAPVPVEIVKPGTGIFASVGWMGTVLLQYIGLLSAAGLLTIFMLLNRGHLRNRLFRLLGQGHLVLMTTALDEAAQRVSRYLLTQSVVNTSFGALLALGLWLIGVPYAPVWGVMAAMLRFLPYVGTSLAAAGPFLLALATFDGWSKPVLTLTLFGIIEAATSGIIEPWLYATRTGVSSLAILLSATFWTLVWGPIGLVLATPLTVCLTVLGRHVAPLEFLYVLLGDEPVLTPEVCYYQRLLAMDEEEAAELAETFLKEKTVAELYDEMLIPALGLAEQDRHNDRLEDERAEFLYRSTRDLVDELGDRNTTDSPSVNPSPSIVCLPVRDEADELIASMLAQVLRQSGCDATWLGVEETKDVFRRPRDTAPDIVVLSAMPPYALLPARAVCRHIRRVYPAAKVMLCIWGSSAPTDKIKERLGATCANAFATTIREAREQLPVLLHPTRSGEVEETAEAEPLIDSVGTVAT